MENESEEYYKLGILSKDVRIILEAYRICNSPDVFLGAYREQMLRAFSILGKSITDAMRPCPELELSPQSSPPRTVSFETEQPWDIGPTAMSGGDGTMMQASFSSGEQPSWFLSSTSLSHSTWPLIASPVSLDFKSETLASSRIGRYLEEKGAMGFACAASILLLVGLWFFLPLLKADAERRIWRASIPIYLCHMCVNTACVFLVMHRCNRDLFRITMTYCESAILSIALIVSRILWMFLYVRIEGSAISFLLLDIPIFLSTLPLFFVLSAPDCVMCSRSVKILTYAIAFIVCAVFLHHGRCINEAWDAPSGCSLFSANGISNREIFMFCCVQPTVFFAKQVIRLCFNSHFTILQPRYVSQWKDRLERDSSSHVVTAKVQSKRLRFLLGLFNASPSPIIADSGGADKSSGFGRCSENCSDISHGPDDFLVGCADALLSTARGVDAVKSLLHDIVVAFELDPRIDLEHVLNPGMCRIYGFPRKLVVSRRTVLSSQFGFLLERRRSMGFVISMSMVSLVVVYMWPTIFSFSRNSTWYIVHGTSMLLFILLGLHRINRDVFLKTALSFDTIALLCVATVKQVVGRHKSHAEQGNHVPLVVAIYWDVSNVAFFILAFCVDAARLERRFKQCAYAVLILVMLYVYVDVRCTEEGWDDSNDPDCSLRAVLNDKSLRDAYANTFIIICICALKNLSAFVGGHEYSVVRPQYIPESVILRNSAMCKNLRLETIVGNSDSSNTICELSSSAAALAEDSFTLDSFYDTSSTQDEHMQAQVCTFFQQEGENSFRLKI